MRRPLAALLLALLASCGMPEYVGARDSVSPYQVGSCDMPPSVPHAH